MFFLDMHNLPTCFFYIFHTSSPVLQLHLSSTTNANAKCLRLLAQKFAHAKKPLYCFLTTNSPHSVSIFRIIYKNRSTKRGTILMEEVPTRNLTHITALSWADSTAGIMVRKFSYHNICIVELNEYLVEVNSRSPALRSSNV